MYGSCREATFFMGFLAWPSWRPVFVRPWRRAGKVPSDATAVARWGKGATSSKAGQQCDLAKMAGLHIEPQQPAFFLSGILQGAGAGWWFRRSIPPLRGKLAGERGLS